MIWMTFNSLSREFHISLKNQLYTMDVALGMDLRVNIQRIGNVLDGIGNLLRDCELRQHRRTRKRKGPAGRFHSAGHIYAIPSALQPH